MKEYQVGDMVIFIIDVMTPEAMGKTIAIVTEIHHTGLMSLKFKDGLKLDFSINDEDIYRIEDLEQYTKPIKFDI